MGGNNILVHSCWHGLRCKAHMQASIKNKKPSNPKRSMLDLSFNDILYFKLTQSKIGKGILADILSSFESVPGRDGCFNSSRAIIPSSPYRKPVTCSKSLIYVTKVNIYVNKHVSAIRMKSPYVIVYEQDNQNA